MTRTIVLAAATAAGVLFAGAAAHAATVYTFTGTAVGAPEFAGDGDFTAIFRIDTPAPSFTFIVNGKSFGFDSDFLPLDIDVNDDTGVTVSLLAHGHKSLMGGPGYTDMHFRVSTVSSIRSHLGGENVQKIHGQTFLIPIGYDLFPTDLAITTEPDLAPGYLDIANVPDGHLVQGLPEPATWALMLLGFGGAGGALRRRGAQVA